MLDADLVIGAVLVPGAKAPKLVSNELVSRMKPGSVLVDIAVDQGGCFEDTHAHHARRPDLPRCTTRSSTAWPTCPARCRNTSTYALTNVTLPYAVALADKGWPRALRGRPRPGAAASTPTPASSSYARSPRRTGMPVGAAGGGARA